jgi:hypothetical protein
MQTLSLQVPLPPDDPDAAARVLRAIAAALGGPALDEAVHPHDSTPASSTPYMDADGEHSLHRLVMQITPKARWLLRQIASDNLSSGESRGRTIRQRAGNVNEGTLGGWVWSITSATRKFGLPKPYDTGYEERGDGWQVIYRMNSKVAEAVVEMVDEDGGLRN